jgi:hypothetical protein
VLEVDENRILGVVLRRMLDIVLKIDFIPALADSAVIVRGPLSVLFLLASNRFDSINLEPLIRLLLERVLRPMRNVVRVVLRHLFRGFDIVPLFPSVRVHHQKSEVVNVGVVPFEVKPKDRLVLR